MVLVLEKTLKELPDREMSGDAPVVNPEKISINLLKMRDRVYSSHQCTDFDDLVPCVSSIVRDTARSPKLPQDSAAGFFSGIQR